MRAFEAQSRCSAGLTKGKRKKPTLVKFHARVPNVPVECKETVPDWDTVGKTLSKENPCYYVTGACHLFPACNPDHKPTRCAEQQQSGDSPARTDSLSVMLHVAAGKAAHQDPHSDVFGTWGAEGYAQWWESTKWSAEGQNFNMGGRGAWASWQRRVSQIAVSKAKLRQALSSARLKRSEKSRI